ncbi:MAG: sulfate ABC transporter ATP-binding protein [Proteobacteria bacterium]|nr:sulfate ABC transporter ATP-binding protein [Pseudomonadota bacterium]
MSIRVENITKTFGGFTALHGLSLDFPHGQLTALLGPSGCGKTTLLRIIAGLEQADAGTILLEGEDATDKHVRERQVGFVFQHYALFRHMSVFENVAFGLRVKPRSKRLGEAEIRKKVMALLDMVQLARLADRFPAQLSGGQRQRVALARALAVEPQVLLLDEPFGALDAKVRKELRRWLRQLHDELHITSIFVTHDQEEALELADRIVVMNEGKIEQIGTPQEVYDHPATPFVYSFLGTSNILRGDMADGKFRPGGNAGSLAYIRPHELMVTRQGGPDAIAATVRRVFEFGALSRIELAGENQSYEVEMPQAERASLALQAGDAVFLQPRRLQVFAADGPDYVI